MSSHMGPTPHQILGLLRFQSHPLTKKMSSRMIWRTEWWVVLFDTRLFQCVSTLNLVLLPTLIDIKYWCKSLLGGRWTRTFGAMNANILEPRGITWRSELASSYTNDHLRLFFTWNTPDWSFRLKLHYFFFKCRNRRYFITHYCGDGTQSKSFFSEELFLDMSEWWYHAKKQLKWSCSQKIQWIIRYLTYTQYTNRLQID